MPAAVRDTRFRTPVESINVPSAAKCQVTGRAEPLFSAYYIPYIIMDNNRTTYSTVNTVDTVATKSADLIASEAISTQEMKALEIYFEHYAQEVLASFRQKMSPGDDLPHYLLRQLEKSKTLLASLELPWERYIPVLYRAFSLYFIHAEDASARQKALNLTSDLMSVVVLLSQSGRLINHLCAYYHAEAENLRKWIDENAERKSLQGGI